MNTDQTCIQCGAPLPPDAPRGLCPECLLQTALSPGDRMQYFGNYELIEEIALGGMGIVWKARQLSLNRVVALKMIRGGILADADDVRRFQAEAEAAANLQHPHIVAIHEVGEYEGQHFFTMDFIEGQSLDHHTDGQPLPPERAARLLATIATAVEFAHQHGIVHRDLKPQNVMIDPTGEPRLTDFGLAKRMDLDSGLTQTGAILGSPSYMAPEQARAALGEVGPRSDVYALGAILYETLTGRPPFRAATAIETVRQVVEREPAPPRSVNPAASRDLETICLKCLEKIPARRYASAQEVADELGRFLRHEPIKARPATRIERAQKWAKRKPAFAALVAVSVVALLAFGGGALRYAETLRIHGAMLNERLHLTLVEQARAERLLGHREVALQRIVEAAAIKRTPELRSEAIQTIAQPGVRKVFDAPMGAVVVSRFSADGRLFAVGGEGFVTPDWPGYAENSWQTFVRVWDVPTGRELATLPWYLEGGPIALSPDSRMLAVPQGDEQGGGLALWEFAAGKVSARLPVTGPSLFSPDGKRLAVQESKGVSLFAREGDEWKPGPRHDFAAVVLAWTAPDELLMQRLAWPGPELEIAQRNSTNDSMRLIRWNVATGQQTFPVNDGGFIRVRNQGVYPTGEGYGPDTEEVLAVSADGRAAATHLMAPSASTELFIRDLDTGNKLGTVRLSPFPNVATEHPETILLSARGRRLIIADAVEQGRLRVYDVNSDKFLVGIGEPGASLAKAFGQVHHGPVSSSGHSGSGAEMVRHESRFLQSRHSNRPSHEVSWVSPVRNFSPDGSLFATAMDGGERSIALWELDSSRRFASVPNAWNPVWSDDGHWLAVETHGMIPGASGGSSSGNSAQVWEVLHGTPTHRLPAALRKLAFSPDGRRLAAHLDDLEGSVLWDVERSSAGMLLHATKEKLAGEEVFFGTDATWVLHDRNHYSAGLDVLARLRRLDSEDKSFDLLGSDTRNWVLKHAVTPDGQRLLICLNPAASGNNNEFPAEVFQLWDLTERKRLTTWMHPGYEKRFGSGCRKGPLVFSPDGRRVALACYGVAGIEVWDAVTGQRLHAHQQPVDSPPPRQPGIVTQFFRNIIYSQGIPPAQEGPFMERSVEAIAFTPDSRLVISCAERRAVIREVESGRELAQCRAAAHQLCLAISPDGRTLATGGEDHVIHFWALPSGHELARWPAHDAAVTALAFSPDGTTLASGAKDGTMKLWDLPSLRHGLAELGLDW